jgi:hypothetical protein
MSGVDERDGETSIEQVFEAFGEHLLEELAAGAIGRVESYDENAQTCDVQPVMRRALLCTDGSRRHVEFPILRRVRVEWPRAVDWYIHFPLGPGDFVGLTYLDRDHAPWGQTGRTNNPLDTRLHHVSHAIARPGVDPDGLALAGMPTDALVMGRRGGATIRIQQNGDVVLSAHSTGKVRGGSAGANTRVVLETPTDVHFDAIAADLTAMSLLLTGPFTPTYGTAARAVLKVSQPIGATKLVAE